MTSTQKKFVKFLKVSIIIVLMIIITLFMISALKTNVLAQGAEKSGNAIQKIDPKVVSWGFLSSAIVVGLGSIGAGIAVGYVGAAALGTLGEKPEMFGKALIFVALAEGIAIYGVIIAMMILGKLG